MAWQVLRAHINAIETAKPVSPYCKQAIELVINGTSSDVALDLANDSGTFWTAALADGTYGAVAAKVLAAMRAIQKSAAAVTTFGGNFTLYRARVKTGAAVDGTDYEATYDSSKCMNFTFAASHGPGGTNLFIEWEMSPGFVAWQMDILP